MDVAAQRDCRAETGRGLPQTVDTKLEAHYCLKDNYVWTGVSKYLLPYSVEYQTLKHIL